MHGGKNVTNDAGLHSVEITLLGVFEASEKNEKIFDKLVLLKSFNLSFCRGMK